MFSWLRKRKSPVVAMTPAGRVLYRFQALHDFYSPEVRSQYFDGGIYNVREGNAKLDGLVKEWIDESKVREL